MLAATPHPSPRVFDGVAVGWRLELEDGTVFADLPGDVYGDPGTLGVDVVGFDVKETPYSTVNVRTARRLEGVRATLYQALGTVSVPVLSGVLTGTITEPGGNVVATLAPPNPGSEGLYLLPDPSWVCDADSFPVSTAYTFHVAEGVEDAVYPVFFGRGGQYQQVITSTYIPVYLQGRAAPAYLTESGFPSAIGILFSRFLLTEGWVEGTDQVYIWDSSELRGKLIDVVRTWDRHNRPITVADLNGDGSGVGANDEHSYHWSSYAGWVGGRGLGDVLIYLADKAKVPLDRAAVELARAPLNRFEVGGCVATPTNFVTWFRELIAPLFPVVMITGPSGKVAWYYVPEGGSGAGPLLTDIQDGGDVSFSNAYGEIKIKATEVTLEFAQSADSEVYGRTLTFGPGPTPRRPALTVPVGYVVSPDLLRASLDFTLPVKVQSPIIWTDETAHLVCADLAGRWGRPRYAFTGRCPPGYAVGLGECSVSVSRWAWASGPPVRAMITAVTIARDGWVQFEGETL